MDGLNYSVKLFYCKVEEIADTTQKAKITVRVLPFMEGMDKQFLPTVSPLFTKYDSTTISNDFVPVKGTYIWCIFFDDFYKQGFYLLPSFVEGNFNYQEIINTLQSGISELTTQSYNDLRFTQFPDGSIEFRNLNTGEVGLYHNSGSYTLMKSNGDIVNSAPNGATNILLTATDIQLSGNTDNVVKYNGFVTVMNTLIQKINLMTWADPISGICGVANVPITVDLTPAKSNKVKLGG